MEFRYYKNEGEKYTLIRPFDRFKSKAPIIGLIVFAMMIVLAYSEQSEISLKNVGLSAMTAFCFLVIIGFVTYGIVPCEVSILPKERLINIKHKNQQQQYSLDQFMNFETIRLRFNGIPIGRFVAMYLDKNNQVYIGFARNKNNAAQIVQETATLLKS